MFWKIKLLLIKQESARISILRIHAESLKEALEKSLDLYRNALILFYQKEGDTKIAINSNRGL